MRLPLQLLACAVLVVLQGPLSVAAQCLSLQGSALCPRYQSLSINPTNLSRAWSFFDGVTTVAEFDAAFALYLAPNGQFARTKQVNELGCTNGATGGLVLQYQRTFLCGEFTSISYSQACNSDTAMASTMTCQSTCLTFAGSENDIVANSTICPTNLAPTTRNATLIKDFTQCTDWVTLATANTSTCVTGASNEGSCGFGISTTQMCNYCNPAKGLVDPCCIGSSTDLSSCGFSVNAAQVSQTSTSTSSTPATSTSSTSPTSSIAPAIVQQSVKHKLSGGAIAGAVIGSLVGATLLAILAIFLCCGLGGAKKRRRAGVAGLDSETGTSSPHMTENATPVSLATPYSGTAVGSPYNEKNHSQDSDWDSKPSGAEMAGLGVAGAAVGAGAATAAKHESRPLSGMTHMTAQSEFTDPDDGRVLLSEFQDMYSPAKIKPGQQVEAIYAYAPTLPDELQLIPGDMVQVSKLFDDNWGFGELHDPDGLVRTGTFPLVCVTAGGSTRGDSTQGLSTSARSQSHAPSEPYHTAASVDVSERGSSFGDSGGNSGGSVPPPPVATNISGLYFPSKPTRRP